MCTTHWSVLSLLLVALQLLAWLFVLKHGTADQYEALGCCLNVVYCQLHVLKAGHSVC